MCAASRQKGSAIYMNADDKKILRKFIMARADRTKALLQRELNKKLQSVPVEVDVTTIRDASTMMAIEQWNRVLGELADEANELVKLGLYPLTQRNRRNGYGYSSQNAITKPDYTANNICDHLGEFDAKQSIFRLDTLVEDDKKLLRDAHAKAVRALDDTVDEALLDMISQDLPGIRDQLKKLTDMFDKVLTDYGADLSDIE